MFKPSGSPPLKGRCCTTPILRLLPDYSQATPILSLLLLIIAYSHIQIIHKLLIFSDIPPRLLLLSLKTLGQFEPTLSCYEIKEPLHSDAVQALAGDTIPALKTQTAFIAITPLNS